MQKSKKLGFFAQLCNNFEYNKQRKLTLSFYQKGLSKIRPCNPVDGGILSSDLCKVYINPLLNNLSDSYLGMKIGNVTVMLVHVQMM